MADSGDSSPHSADDAHHHHHPDTTNNASPETTAAQAAAAVAVAPTVPPPAPTVPAKVRLMVSYGGRIQPRPHDNQLSYVNGDTKILSIERPLRFPDFAARLAGLAGARGDLCVKYQLPGEDLDALVSVTNDEDLEHLVIEYDRLHLFRAAPGSGGSSRGGSTPRLRVFLFPVVQPPRPASPPKQQEQREWYLDLKSASPPPPLQNQQMQPQMMKQETVPVQSPPPAAPMVVPQPVMVASKTGPDYLFGFDYGFMPPPAVKVKDPAGDPPKMRENVPVEIPPKNEDRHPNPAADNNNAMVSPAVSPAEFPRQIPDLEKLQLADNATQQQPPPPPAPAPAPQAAPAPAPVVAPAAPVPAPCRGTAATTPSPAPTLQPPPPRLPQQSTMLPSSRRSPQSRLHHRLPLRRPSCRCLAGMDLLPLALALTLALSSSSRRRPMVTTPAPTPAAPPTTPSRRTTTAMPTGTAPHPPLPCRALRATRRWRRTTATAAPSTTPACSLSTLRPSTAAACQRPQQCSARSRRSRCR